MSPEQYESDEKRANLIQDCLEHINVDTNIQSKLIAMGVGDKTRDFFGPKASLVEHIVVCLFYSTISIGGAIYAYIGILNTAEDLDYDNFLYAIILFIGSNLCIWLNYADDNHYGWKSFQVNFEKACGHEGITVYGLGFFTFALTWFIIAGIQDGYNVEYTYWDQQTSYYLLYFSFYISFIFFICTCLAGWELISYYASTLSLIHGFLYLSIFGGVVLESARLLRPPRDDNYRATWHKRHDTDVLLTGVFIVVNYAWWFFVVLGCVGLALFSEFALWTSTLGLGWAMLLFTIGAYAVMLNPIAPGSVIDCCGGFLFLIVFAKQLEWGFWLSWIVGLAIMIFYHYTGACIQWWLGTMPSVQIWLNIYMPVDMLCTTDAVLKDANWFNVGLIGYVFLDTLNGLNQGRINMEFWTQLLSEWACVPSAIALSLLGSSLAVEALEPGMINSVIAERITTVIPLLMLIASLIACGGSLFGLRALGNSTDGKACWLSREKWAAMHFFHNIGISATKTGYKNDIFQLASDLDGNTKNGLFSKVYPVQIYYIAQRESSTTQRDKLLALDEFSENLKYVRSTHYQNILENIKDLANKDDPWIFEQEHNDDVPENRDFWHDAKNVPWKRNFQLFVCVTLILAFWGSMLGFYLSLSMADAVGRGWSSVKDTNPLYWLALAYFFVTYNLYNYKWWIDSCSSLVSTISWFAFGCKTVEGLETQFETPKWDVPKELEYDVAKELSIKYGKNFDCCQINVALILDNISDGDENRVLKNNIIMKKIIVKSSTDNSVEYC